MFKDRLKATIASGAYDKDKVINALINAMDGEALSLIAQFKNVQPDYGEMGGKARGIIPDAILAYNDASHFIPPVCLVGYWHKIYFMVNSCIQAIIWTQDRGAHMNADLKALFCKDGRDSICVHCFTDGTWSNCLLYSESPALG